MKEPTQEQIKELWEWCGLKLRNGTFYNTDNKPHYKLGYFPPTLDSLFKDAVPKAGHLKLEHIIGNGL